MSVNLITGYAGTAHITSAGDGAVNAGMYTTSKYVFNIGEKFGYEIISNNLIRIKSGYAINQGRKIELAVNDYEEVEIDNGLQGVKRCDLIVLHYEKNLTTGIETATMQVIKGTSGDDYTDPAYTSGNIIDGANEDDFLLYRVKINGLNIEAVEQMFTVTNSIMTLLGRKAPTNHASTATSYGLGTTSKFGHLKVSDTYTSKVGAAANGIAASQAALYEAYTSLNESLVTTNKNVTTAQNTANTAIASANSTLTFSSTIYFNPCGTAFVNKAGKMCAIHTIFQCKDLAAGAVIASIPDGYRPKINYQNIGIPRIDVSSAVVVTIKITTAGQIVTHNSVPAGLYMLDFSYATS